MTAISSSTVIEIEFNEPVVVINLVLSSGTSLWIKTLVREPVGPQGLWDRERINKYVLGGVKILKFPFLVRLTLRDQIYISEIDNASLNRC